jgi:UPF0042 nucleotide-binding protein
MLPTIVDLASQPGGIERLALVAGRNHADVLAHIDQIRKDGHRITVVFLDASTPVLVQRYDATRRKHPRSDTAGGLVEAIDAERRELQPIKEQADLVIDTSDLNVHQLKERLVAAFERDGTSRLQIAVESFGYKNGLPLDADIVMDVRFLPNPHWDEALRPLTGLDEPVRDYVLDRGVTRAFLDDFERMLIEILPAYQAEGRSYLTIAIGCTGGRHRSVAIAEELARRFSLRGIAAKTTHRDTPG